MSDNQDSLGLFTGELALVTGTASNIGRAIATGIAREGAEVILLDVDPGRNDDTAQAIRAIGGECSTLTADLSVPDGWKRALDGLDSHAPAIFVHSACPPRHETDTPRAVSEETFDAMWSVNVRAGLFLGRELAKRMIESGTAGRMLYITSLHAVTPRNLVHYSASKAAMTLVMRELARDLARHRIRVNALAPGAVPGGGNTNVTPEFAAMLPVGRVGTPDDMVGPAIALLSDRFCAHVTGQTLAVDGGLSLYNWIPFTED